MEMHWDLSNEKEWVLVHAFEYPRAFSYADMRPGYTDREKREYIRGEATKSWPKFIPEVRWWAFRIFVRKGGKQRFDAENAVKLIVDSFCKRQIREDDSEYGCLGLFEDDTIDFVRAVEVAGERTPDSDSTRVEIFGHK